MKRSKVKQKLLADLIRFEKHRPRDIHSVIMVGGIHKHIEIDLRVRRRVGRDQLDAEMVVVELRAGGGGKSEHGEGIGHAGFPVRSVHEIIRRLRISAHRRPGEVQADCARHGGRAADHGTGVGDFLRSHVDDVGVVRDLKEDLAVFHRPVGRTGRDVVGAVAGGEQGAAGGSGDGEVDVFLAPVCTDVVAYRKVFILYVPFESEQDCIGERNGTGSKENLDFTPSVNLVEESSVGLQAPRKSFLQCVLEDTVDLDDDTFVGLDDTVMARDRQPARMLKTCMVD